MKFSKDLSEIIRKDNDFGDWKILEESIGKVFNRSSHIQKLIVAGYLAVCRVERDLSDIIIALCSIQKSIILVDDILDNDIKGDHVQIGTGRASNRAHAFLGYAFQKIIRSEFSEHQKLNIYDVLSKMIFDTANGQRLDVSIPKTEQAYWEMVKLKSSSFYGALFEVGAIAGNPKSKDIKIVRKFGDLYGEMIQIHDDLLDCLAPTPGPDWIEGRLPLPILFVEMVDHPQHNEFIELRENIEENNNLEKAQKILISSGAVAYCIDQLFPREKKAKEILDQGENLDNTILEDILKEVMVAPNELIENIKKYRS